MQSGQARYSWIVPKHDDLTSPCKRGTKLGEIEIASLMQLAAASRWLLAVGRREVLDAARVSSLLWDRLSEVDLAGSGMRLRQAAAAQSFCRFFEALRKITELERVAATPSVAYSQLLSVLNGRAGGLHPLRIACSITWLFPDIESFAQRYGGHRAEQHASAIQHDSAKIDRNEAKRTRFLRLLDSGLSISRSANQAGVEVATGQAWAALVGVHVPRRASVIRDDLRYRMIQVLKGGADKSDAARHFNVSISSVNRILRTEAGLHEAWKAARDEASIRRMRSMWNRTLTGFGGRSKLARAAQPAVYAWLYRNDRVWLQDGSRLHRARRSNNSKADWGVRDSQLSTEVRQAAAEISAIGKSQTRLLDLLARLPHLKRNLSNLKRLPLTDRVLEQTIGHRRVSRGRGLFD